MTGCPPAGHVFRLPQRLVLVALFCMVSGLNDLSCDRFVVRLTPEEEKLEIQGAAVRQADEPPPGDHSTTSVAPTPKVRVVGMSIRGHRFTCHLPLAFARGSRAQRVERAERYAASALAVALASRCVRGRVEDTGEDFELCINDRFIVGGAYASHEVGSDRLLTSGGFEQFYTGIVGGGHALRVWLSCKCLFPMAPPPEPPCRPGDVVTAPRGVDGRLHSAVVASRGRGGEGNEGELLHLNWAKVASYYHRASVGACGIAGDEFHECCDCPVDHPKDLCKRLCDADAHCVGFAFAGDGRSCQYATTSTCTSGCVKRYEGKMGAIASAPGSGFGGCHVKTTPAGEKAVRDVVEAAAATGEDGRACGVRLELPDFTQVRVLHSTIGNGGGSATCSLDGRDPEEETASCVAAGHSSSSRAFNVEVATTTCCSMQELQAEAAREGEAPGTDISLRRLLSPLIGRCIRAVHGWWTYELCWPWRVRQLHLTVDGWVEVAGISLGNFSGVGLSLRRVTPRDDGGRYELLASLEGDSCAKTVQRWTVSLSSRSGDGADDEDGGAPSRSAGTGALSGVGGFFNPAGSDGTEGSLAHDTANPDGCKEYKGRLDGRIVLVRRGECWFHSKAINAQAAGAVAVLVFNEHQQMVDVMEGILELPSPQIPTVLIGQALGITLLNSLGSHAKLTKVGENGANIHRPLTTSVYFRCGAAFNERREACEPGDQVDVRIVSANESASRWPNSAVRIVKAIVADVNRANKTLHVAPLPDEEAIDETLPEVVPMSSTFHGGVPCDSDGDAYFEDIGEPQACHSEFVVHVAALCAHPWLVPPQPRAAQIIGCHPEDLPSVASARRAWEAESETASEPSEGTSTEQIEQSPD
eukprot:CAMPEP_0117569744 /NCGR_PEP_ID=MMETSP0784-20121206/58823_1 /TAXON_ID=39447 /ORGANISM="" /LENGTH=869 /DNA_ID=CAMNT_0005367741 /DNA_START=80 /DNA_END=2689 /DNA_ORIENTATION=+